jgi:hypothetical protein
MFQQLLDYLLDGNVVIHPTPGKGDCFPLSINKAFGLLLINSGALGNVPKTPISQMSQTQSDSLVKLQRQWYSNMWLGVTLTGGQKRIVQETKLPIVETLERKRWEQKIFERTQTIANSKASIQEIVLAADEDDKQKLEQVIVAIESVLLPTTKLVLSAKGNFELQLKYINTTFVAEIGNYLSSDYDVRLPKLLSQYLSDIKYLRAYKEQIETLMPDDPTLLLAMRESILLSSFWATGDFIQTDITSMSYILQRPVVLYLVSKCPYSAMYRFTPMTSEGCTSNTPVYSFMYYTGDHYQPISINGIFLFTEQDLPGWDKKGNLNYRKYLENMMAEYQPKLGPEEVSD